MTWRTTFLFVLKRRAKSHVSCATRKWHTIGAIWRSSTNIGMLTLLMYQLSTKVKTESPKNRIDLPLRMDLLQRELIGEIWDSESSEKNKESNLLKEDSASSLVEGRITRKPTRPAKVFTPLKKVVFEPFEPCLERNKDVRSWERSKCWLFGDNEPETSVQDMASLRRILYIWLNFDSICREQTRNYRNNRNLLLLLFVLCVFWMKRKTYVPCTGKRHALCM